MGNGMKDRILCRVLTGPTASGKTAVSLRLAEKNGWEILCMDSMQIYRRMDIGTAKPTAEERRRVPHHLLDFVEPSEPFSVSDYVRRAESLVKDLAKEGKQVLFVGGTGLYLQALMHPMGMGGVPANPALRAELNELAMRSGGKEVLHAYLESLDPETAFRLPLGDIRRTIRAIEVTKATGIPFSRQPDRAEASPFRWKAVSTALPRSELYDRINSRVDHMIRDGLYDEVASLLAEGVHDDAQSMSAIGYKEMVPCVRGQRSLEETADLIRTASRHYAKRQETFLKRMEEIRYVDMCAPDAEEQIQNDLEQTE